MDNNYNGFSPEGGNNMQQDVQQPVYNDALSESAADFGAGGTPVQPEAQYADFAGNNFASQAAYNAAETIGADGTVAVAKKKSKLPFIIGGSVLGIAGVGALLFAFVAPVKNWVKLTFMKPEKYFASVEEQAFSEYSSKIAQSYGDIVEVLQSEDGTTVSYGVEMTFGDKFAEILNEELEAGGEEVPEFILESVGVDMDAASDSEKGGVSASVTLNGENVVSANAVYDIAEQMFYMQIPELSEAYLTASLEQYMAQSGVDFSEFDFDTDVLISEEEMKGLIEDYANIVYSSIDAVEIEKGEKIDVAGNEYSFNVMEFELSGEELLDIVVDVVEAAAEEEAFADMYDEFIRCLEESGALDAADAEEGVDTDMSYEELMEQLVDSLKDIEMEDDIEIVGRIYVDARGVIMGREYTIEADGEEATLYYIIGADSKDELCIEAFVEFDGEEVASLEFARLESEFDGNITVEGEEILTVSGDYEDEAYSGTLAIIIPEEESYDDYDYYEDEEESDDEDEDEDEEESSSDTIEIGFEDLKTVGENDEFLSGTIFFEFSQIDDEEAVAEFEEYGVERIDIVFESDGKGQDVSLVLGELVSLTVSVSSEEGADVDVPSDGDFYDIETEIDAYLEAADYEGFITNILEILGVEDEVTSEEIDEIIAQIQGSMSSGDDYYDDWEDDDYYDDWEDDDYYDDWEDDDYVTYEDDYVFVDFFDTIEINAFGNDIAWPATAETFCAYFDIDSEITTEGYDSDYAISYWGSELDFYNPFEYDVRTGDCFVSYLYVCSDDDGLLVTVNDVGIGSSIDDINDAFDTDFDVVYGEVEIEDNYYYDSVTFYLEDGVVTDFILYGDEDYIYDNFDDYNIGGISDDTIDYTWEDGTLTIVCWTDADARHMIEQYKAASGADNVQLELVGRDGGDACMQYEAYLLGGDDVDIFMCDVDWVLKYANDAYALPLSEVGITEADLANQFSYTTSIGKANGDLYATSFQATPGGYVYNNDLAETFLGVRSGADMQAKMSDWDGFKATAAELYAATDGYVKICPSLGGLWQVYSANRSAPWVTSDNKLNIGEAEGFVTLAKELVDNGYVDPTIGQWSSDWAPMGANGTALGFFGCTWCVKEVGGQLEGWQGDTGSWTLIAGPQAYSWGGTYFCVSKNADNKGMAGDFIRMFCVNESTMYEYAVTTGDYLNNASVMQTIVDEGINSNALLGGQDQFAVFNEVAPLIDIDGVVTKYDATIKAKFLDAVTAYCKGEIDDWQGTFTASVQEAYPTEFNW